MDEAAVVADLGSNGPGRRRRRVLAGAGLLVGLLVAAVGSMSLMGRTTSSKFSAVGSAISGGGPVARGVVPTTAGATGGSPAAGRTAGAPPELDLAAASTAGREVISTGTLRVEVDDVLATKERARASIVVAGGMLFSEQTDTGSRPTSTLTFKIPPEHFDQASRDLGALGRLVGSELETDDVTQQVVDLDARVRSAAASLDRVRDLVGRTNNVGELANLENEVQRRQTDLETLEGQQRTLAKRTELATLVLTLTAKAPTPLGATAAPPADPAHPGFLDGLRVGWDALVSTMSVLGALVGALLPFAWLALIPLGIWWHRRRHAVPADAV